MARALYARVRLRPWTRILYPLWWVQVRLNLDPWVPRRAVEVRLDHD